MNGKKNHADPESGQPRLNRSAPRALVQDFGGIWFTWCMNSGIIAILMHQCPYQFSGLGILADIFFVFDLSLFVIFSLIFIAKFAIFRSGAYSEIVENFQELTFFACWPIAWLTLVSLVSLLVSQARWGAYPFTIVSYVMWWFGMAWSLVTLFWVFITLIRRHEASDRRMGCSIIIPAVSMSTVAVTGGIVASLAYDISPTLAVPVIVVSFMCLGIGLLLGLILYVYLFHAFLAEGWPPAQQITSVFIFVGPTGQSAAAFQILGAAASKYKNFALYNKGSFLSAEAAPALDAACVMMALLLTGLGVIWITLSFYSFIECAFKGNLKWSHSWNAIVFPMGTATTSMSLFAVDMDSPAFRVITAMMLIFLVIVFLNNLIFTIWNIFQGKMLIVREDPRVKKQIENEQKER